MRKLHYSVVVNIRIPVAWGYARLSIGFCILGRQYMYVYRLFVVGAEGKGWVGWFLHKGCVRKNERDLQNGLKCLIRVENDNKWGYMGWLIKKNTAIGKIPCCLLHTKIGKNKQQWTCFGFPHFSCSFTQNISLIFPASEKKRHENLSVSSGSPSLTSKSNGNFPFVVIYPLCYIEFKLCMPPTFGGSVSKSDLIYTHPAGMYTMG